jgi:hypothetical protein
VAENSIRFSVNEADASCAGREAVLAKLSEVLFVAGNPTRSKARSATSTPVYPRDCVRNRGSPMGVGQFPITALPDTMVPKRTAVQVLEFHSAQHRGESYLILSLRSDTPEHF